MICKGCGADVSSSEVFCPNCGAPLRVTADYDYIQAEIGVKVDQFLNDEPEEMEPAAVDSTLTEPELTIIGAKAAEEAPANTIRIPRDPGLNIIGDPSSQTPFKAEIPEKPRAEKPKENLENTISITRTLYVKDSIFADEDAPDFDDDFTERIEKQQIKKQSERKAEPKRSNPDSRDAKRQAAERARKKKKTIILIAVIAAVVIAAVVGIILATSGKKEESKEESFQILSNVENGGSYSAPLEVTLEGEQECRIFYTLDGSDPTLEKGTKYGQPIEFSNKDVTGDSLEVNLIAFAYKKDASVKVGELRITFTLTKSAVTPPSFDLASGDYWEASYITITADEGSTIYYTYDGSTPSENSTKYTGPVEMKRGNYVLSAIAVDDSGEVSEVTSSVYNLIIESWISYDEALGNVLNMLVNEQMIESTETDENGYYKVPGGGTRRIINGGEAVVDNTNYYVIQVDYLNDGSNVQATSYYGVNDQTGEVIRLNRSGMNYVLG